MAYYRRRSYGRRHGGYRRYSRKHYRSRARHMRAPGRRAGYAGYRATGISTGRNLDTRTTRGLPKPQVVKFYFVSPLKLSGTLGYYRSITANNPRRPWSSGAQAAVGFSQWMSMYGNGCCVATDFEVVFKRSDYITGSETTYQACVGFAYLHTSTVPLFTTFEEMSSAGSVLFCDIPKVDDGTERSRIKLSTRPKVWFQVETLKDATFNYSFTFGANPNVVYFIHFGVITPMASVIPSGIVDATVSMNYVCVLNPVQSSIVSADPEDREVADLLQHATLGSDDPVPPPTCTDDGFELMEDE